MTRVLCIACVYSCFLTEMISVLGIPRYRCTICTRVYTTRRGLRTHIKYHSSDRPHCCSTCGASFKVRSKLADHVKLVHIQKVCHGVLLCLFLSIISWRQTGKIGRLMEDRERSSVLRQYIRKRLLHMMQWLNKICFFSCTTCCQLDENILSSFVT